MSLNKILISVLLLFSFSTNCFSFDEEIYNKNQTSALMIIKYAEKSMISAENKKEAERKYLLLYDIYIKANSYAILNKVFFWFSIVFGLLVLLWPSLSVIFKSKLDRWEWLKSAIVQTTITAIAALMFSFYSQYKDKQTYSETLMRYVLFSNQTSTELYVKVSEELSKIDRGFSFNSILEKQDDKNN